MNPFDVIEERLVSIERLIIQLQKPIQQNPLSELPERPLNIQEAAKFLNLTVSTIYAKVSKGELPFMKRSKRLYFSSIDLMSYLKQGRKKSNSEIKAEAESYINNKKGLNNYGK